MEQIKISFSDFWGGYDMHNNFWTLILKKLEIPYIVVDDESDVLFASCFGLNWTQKKSKKKIFWSGENWFRMDTPIQQLNNYSIVNIFDQVYSFDYNSYQNHYRLPLYLIDSIEKNITDFNLICRLKSKEILEKEFEHRKFCTFIQGNANCKFRNNYFNRLNNVEKIDSYGSLFNNTGEILNRDQKIERTKEYKFQLAFENSEYDGYISEKIIDAFLSDVIPIYWGGTEISKEFNSKSFIDVNKIGLEESISIVNEISKNFEIYWSYYNQKIISVDQISLQDRIDNFYKNFKKFIFNL